MLTWFLLGVAVLVGLGLMLNWAASAQPRNVLKSLKWIALGLAVAVVLLVVMTRNFNLIWGLGVAAIPWIARVRAVMNLWKTLRGPTPGRRSEFSCQFFDVYLDHDSGKMDGRIKEGPFQGALLSELSMEEGRRFHGHIDQIGDDTSLRLLEAYLDRVYRADWRGAEQDGGGRHRDSPPPGDMSETEALALLGLEPGASADDVKAAHRQLMKQVHPDVGGSVYLAAKINAAKDLLIGLS